jgi:hypothetical protein
MTESVPAETAGLRQELGAGPHVKRTDLWAELLTWAHQRWLDRRMRSPWLFVLPIAVIVAVLGPR